MHLASFLVLDQLLFRRSYHLLATASKDGHVRIWKFVEDEVSDQYKVDLIADFVDHDAEVWRVQWNVTGTILSSSGDDGKIRLWKSDVLNEWRCMSVINSDSELPMINSEKLPSSINVR